MMSCLQAMARVRATPVFQSHFTNFLKVTSSPQPRQRITAYNFITITVSTRAWHPLSKAPPQTEPTFISDKRYMLVSPDFSDCLLAHQEQSFCQRSRHTSYLNYTVAVPSLSNIGRHAFYYTISANDEKKNTSLYQLLWISAILIDLISKETRASEWPCLYK